MATLGRGPDMLQRTLALLASVRGVEGVAVSCRACQAEAMRLRLGPDVAVIPDEKGGEVPPTPLKGLTSALRALDCPLLVLPCDFPFLQPRHLEPLLEARAMRLGRGLPLLRTAIRHDDGRTDALAAVYETAALPFLDAALAAGRYSLHSAVPPERQELVPCPDSAAFLNMNTPGDRRAAEALLERA